MESFLQPSPLSCASPSLPPCSTALQFRTSLSSFPSCPTPHPLPPNVFFPFQSLSLSPPKIQMDCCGVQVTHKVERDDFLFISLSLSFPCCQLRLLPHGLNISCKRQKQLWVNISATSDCFIYILADIVFLLIQYNVMYYIKLHYIILDQSTIQ